MAEQAEFSHIGDNVVHVEQLLKEHKKLEGEGQVCLFVCFHFCGLGRRSLWMVTDHGDSLIVRRLPKDTGLAKY